MAIDQKETSLKDFKTSPKINILISSLKCGSLGLNLTEASHVIIVDLWWSVLSS